LPNPPNPPFAAVTVYGDIGFAVAVEIGRHNQIGVETEWHLEIAGLPMMSFYPPY
jgi:hypothetical protein